MKAIGALLAIGLIGSAVAAPSNCRLYLAEQYTWEEKTGFYLDLEGAELATLPLILGLADGNEWRFASHVPGFVPDRDYRIRAVIGPARSEVLLDGQPVFSLESAWKRYARDLVVNNRPGWANDPGDWAAIIRSAQVTVTRAGAEVARHEVDLGAWAGQPAALLLFERASPQALPVTLGADDTLSLDISLRFVRPDLSPHVAFIDRFGQAIAADYPDKVRDEAGLQADIAAEEAQLREVLGPGPVRLGFDAYGGLDPAPWQEPATGFFRVVQREGVWWLLTPEGNPCFYTGVCAVPQLTWETTPVTGRERLFAWLPPREGEFAPAWSRNQWGIEDGTEYCCFYTVNLIRKYGAEWEARATAQALRRLQAARLQGGKWGCGVPLASTPVLNRAGVPNLAGHPDVFDDTVVARLRASLAAQITPRLRDPWVVGWSYGNEYDEIIKRDEMRRIAAMAPETPARRALFAWALETLYADDRVRLGAVWGVKAADLEALHRSQPQVPDADLETLRLHYESRYHETVYRLVKEIDPNHLYLGFWIVPNWWESPDDWMATVPHCDVIGYDRYTPEFADEALLELFRKAGKPVLCGEFSHPPWYGGSRGFGRYPCWAKDEEESVQRYREWVRDAARNRYCVGLIWFLFRDQPLTGRGPGTGEALVHGEHYAFGLVTEQDRVRWPLLKAMREANGKAAEWRMGRE